MAIINTTQESVMEKANATSSNQAGIGKIKITNIKIMATAKKISPRLVELTSISFMLSPKDFRIGEVAIRNYCPCGAEGKSKPSS